MAARIHDVSIKEKPFIKWVDTSRLTVPNSATRPDLWQAAFDLLRQERSRLVSRFIHRDLQQFNLLWADNRLTGIVDWTVASAGPAEIDIGHCRLNLAVMYDPNWAEQFRLAYEAITGRTTDPWWDIYSLASYNDSWPENISNHARGYVTVNTASMTTRVEELLDSILRRL
jgi:aminoglycoside phosphotransferase (APT) family kinase protein